MRILYITTTFSRYSGDPLGAIGNSFFDLCQEMSKIAQVDVVCPMDKETARVTKYGKLTIYREPPTKSYISLESMLRSAQILKIPSLIANLFLRSLVLVKRNRYDVIHGFFIVPSGLIISLLPTNGIRVIGTYGSDLHTLSYKPGMAILFSQILKNVDGINYNAPNMLERLTRLGAKNPRLLPLPLNSKVFKLDRRLPANPQFTFVGRLTEAKGVWTLVEAFKIVLKDIVAAKLTIIGDGPEKEKMRNYVHSNHLDKSIKIVGSQNAITIAKTLKSTYAFLLPSFREGTPAVIVEAMAIGRPVVSTNVGGIPKLVNKDTGYITKPGDPKVFAAAIVKAWHTSYSPEVISMSVKDYRPKLVAKRYMEYYRELIRQRE